MNRYQQGGMSPEEAMMMEQQGAQGQGGNPEEEIAMQIMEAFMLKMHLRCQRG